MSESINPLVLSSVRIAVCCWLMGMRMEIYRDCLSAGVVAVL
jgi:hypothetical protein